MGDLNRLLSVFDFAPMRRGRGNGQARSRPIRLAVVALMPFTQHLARYPALSRDPDIDVVVLFMQRRWTSRVVIDRDLPRFDGYPYEIFPNASPWRDGDGFWKCINPRLIWRVLTGPYDAVYVYGNATFSHVMALVLSLIHI